MKRTHYCGQVTNDMVGEKVVLNGWVDTRRDLGGMIFLDLRDREGKVQVMADSSVSTEAWQTADSVRSEYVVEVEGEIIKRDEENYNPKLINGEVEVQAERVTVLNKSKTPPFELDDADNVSEEIRTRYRYLDLRRPEMQANFKLRHDVTKAIRQYLDGEGFLDVETPFLTKSTPEGARDYLVPSRVHKGAFYALPQSPQLFKQILMNAGFDRYYQIVRCFRDEDLRGDRQPEFTQLDVEASFVDEEDIQNWTEGLFKKIMLDAKGIEIETPFRRMTHEEAINVYGSDKPDLRFGMTLIDLTEAVKESDFKVFSGAVANGGLVKALNVKDGADKYTRKEIDELTEYAGIYGAKGLAWIKVTDEGLTGPIGKFFQGNAVGDAIVAETGAEAGDLLLFVADQAKVVHDALGALRNRLAKELDLIPEDQYEFVWIVDWPLLEYDEDEKRYVAAHHPFTSPQEQDLDKLSTNPEEVTARAYDIVINGYEIGGGSIRINQLETQKEMFKALGFTEKAAEEQFGFFLESMEYGFPPHGGIAFGLDRLVMILAGEENIREVIAFPKNNKAMDPMTQAPDYVSDKQLYELGLELDDETQASLEGED